MVCACLINRVWSISRWLPCWIYMLQPNSQPQASLKLAAPFSNQLFLILNDLHSAAVCCWTTMPVCYLLSVIAIYLATSANWVGQVNYSSSSHSQGPLWSSSLSLYHQKFGWLVGSYKRATQPVSKWTGDSLCAVANQVSPFWSWTASFKPGLPAIKWARVRIRP